MVGRHWAQALVPTEPWGLTLEAEEALSGPWGRVTGDWTPVLLQLVPVSTQPTLRQLLPRSWLGPTWMCYYKGRGRSSQCFRGHSPLVIFSGLLL